MSSPKKNKPNLSRKTLLKLTTEALFYGWLFVGLFFTQNAAFKLLILGAALYELWCFLAEKRAKNKPRNEPTNKPKGPKPTAEQKIRASAFEDDEVHYFTNN